MMVADDVYSIEATPAELSHGCDAIHMTCEF